MAGTLHNKSMWLPMRADAPTDAATHQAALTSGQREKEAGLGKSGRPAAENRRASREDQPKTGAGHQG